MTTDHIHPQKAATSTVYIIKNLADYNLWANAILINYLREKPFEVLQKAVPSSFPSIKATIVNIWQTQVYWLSVIRKFPVNTHEEFTGSLEEAFDLLIEQSEEMADYIAVLNPEVMEDTTLVVNPRFQSNFQNFEYIVQAINHSTFKRGQIVAIGQMFGFTDTPTTDYNYYNIMGK
ncbi:DinB family protein [Pedobacter sp. GR22-6]|uniref:DinB family protein n=1 Tax=Pedobacter sp. GR22-6 TaxID=3127957 RepID=UPI00307DE7D8